MTTTAPTEPSKTCTAVFTGTNSYGGGGPGQSTINQNAWSIELTGAGKDWHSDLEQDGSLGVVGRSVKGGDFGGNSDIDVGADWNYGGMAWYSCHVTVKGKDYKGKVQKQHISSGTVSVTTDECNVEFPC